MRGNTCDHGTKCHVVIPERTERVLDDGFGRETMAKITETTRKVLFCRTCETEFIIPSSETAVCCPVCRMNRIKQIE